MHTLLSFHTGRPARGPAATALTAGAWEALTWQRPHRDILVGISGGILLSTGVIGLIPRRRLLRSRWTAPGFALWTLALLWLVLLSAALDGGIDSPVMLCVFPCVVYPALVYPRWAVLLLQNRSCDRRAVPSSRDRARIAFMALFSAGVAAFAVH